MDELDKILQEDKTREEMTTPEPASPDKPNTGDDELAKKQQQLENLSRAISEANAELKRIRETKRTAPEDEEIPSIDMSDPSSKAWNKHISEMVNPLHSEMEKEKEEIRRFAFQEFMADKPGLASNPEKVKELMFVYDRIKTASERTKEGVLSDLNKAFAAVYSDELISRARDNRAENARKDMLFSNPGISRGAGALQPDTAANPSDSLTAEERDAVVRMYGSIDEYNKYAKANA